MAKKAQRTETDSVYFLKVFIYFVLGTIWIKVNGSPVFPAGLVAGLVIAHKEHFQIDRKVEYAVLLVASLIALAGYGIYLAVSY